GDTPQLLNLLFGNISLKSGILIADIEWPPDLLTALGGPRFGIRGVRELAGVHDRPLLCAALKPLGLSPVQLAGVARGFARAGIDIIKDDHSLSDQPSAPFRERVARCQEAVAAANRETGGRALYFPNVTSAPARPRGTRVPGARRWDRRRARAALDRAVRPGHDLSPRQ